MKIKKYLAAMSVMLAAGIAVFPSQRAMAEETDTISKGVYIGGVDVSGMTGEEAAQAVERGMESVKNASITLKVDDAKASVSASDFGLAWENTEVVEEALNLGKSGNIVKRYKDKKDLENENKKYELKYKTDKGKIKQVLEEKADVFNREPEDAQLSTASGSIEVIAGQNGIAVNTEKSAKKISKYMKNEWDGRDAEIELTAEVKKPEYTTEDLSKITDVLGTATTYYGSTYSRNLNVETGASKLNGHLVMPGDVFSVTEAVAPFTAENGYEPAPSYESGKVVDSYGGGICQVSTTLYNAVLKAELEVVERHNHSMIVTYVEPSKDAAIAEGLMDFRFANNTEYPIFISGYAYGGELNFTIYGHETRDPNRVVEYVSETTSTTDPEGAKLTPVADQAVGYLAQTQSAHQGLTAVLWKYVTENGETKKEQVNYSSYQATPTCYDVGTNTDNQELLSALQTAIGNNDLEQVQAIISGNWGKEEESESETQQSESQKEDQGDGQQQSPDNQGGGQPDVNMPDNPSNPQVIG